MKEKIRYLNLLVCVAVLMMLFTGCAGKSMKTFSVVSDDMKNINGSVELGKDEFVPYRVIKIRMPEIAFFSEGIFGGNYFVAFQKDDVDKMLKIEESGEFHKAEIITEAGIPFLYLFDYGKEIDLDRKILVNTRVVPGHQYSIDGEVSCGKYFQTLDWDLFKSLNQYKSEGFVSIIEVDDKNSADHQRTHELIYEIIERYNKYADDNDFERFLKGFGTLTSNEISLFIAGTIDPIRVYPVIGAKVFDIMKAISGAPDLSQPYYESALVDGFKLGVALNSYASLMKTRILEDNEEKNRQLLLIQEREIREWKQAEDQKIENWKSAMTESYQGDEESLEKIEKIYREYLSTNRRMFENRLSSLKALYE